MPHAILVTDFDGTLAQNDFYQLVCDQLMPPGTPDFYHEYRTGQMTHFECLAAYFGTIPTSEERVLELIRQMELEPRLPELLPLLAAKGWEVVVASAGCAWYIEKLLTAAGVSLPVHASRGHWVGNGRGLKMELPTDSPFFSPTTGINKSAVVKHALTRTNLVAFAGDGFTDVPAALLVPPERRFARHDCANELRLMGEPFQPFTRWAEVAETLLAGSSRCGQ